MDRRGRTAPWSLHRLSPAVRRLDAAVSARTDALRLGGGADTALRGLSRAADHSVLWAGAATTLAATGARGRRAAVRGVVTLLGASAVSNLVAKPLLGGARPASSGRDTLRRLSSPPSSGSFPSGHSASATAFVLGVATEWPLAGAALAPVAAAVAYSRLHVGVHWFSDVIGGIAIGAGAAALGRVVVPPRPRRHDLPPPGPPVHLPALPDGDGLVVVVNPSSGAQKGGGDRFDDALRAALPRVRVRTLAPHDDVTRVVADAVAAGARAVGVVGGDGTVGTVAAAARAHDVPLVVLPGGTLNHFARSLHLDDDETDPVEAVATAVRAGTGVAVDVAELEVGEGDARERRTVLNTFALGAYPALVARREQLEGRLGKWAAALVAAGSVLPGADTLPVRTLPDDPGGTGGSARHDVWSVFAGIGRYAPRGPVPVERRRLDDGVLDVRSVLAERRHSRSRTLVRTALGTVGSRVAASVPRARSWLATDAREVERLRLAVLDGTLVAHDGETVEARGNGEVPVTLTLRRGALHVYVPVDADRSGQR